MSWKSRLLAQPPQRVSQVVIKSAAINLENVFGLEIGLPKQRTTYIDTLFWTHHVYRFQTLFFAPKRNCLAMLRVVANDKNMNFDELVG